jgi:peptidoglycan/xylan/chitin deacetylase (PgdA/CDA1 family)
MRLGRAIPWIMRYVQPPQPKPVILMYHRIADEAVDPWGLAVSPARFEEQLKVLRRTRHPLTLVDFVRRFKDGSLPAHAVALTFDDGYADNLLAGKPRLAAADVPATVFLATGYLDRPEEFWWDELARLLLHEHGPQSLAIEVLGSVMSLDLGTEPSASDNRIWTAWSNPLTQRQAGYMVMWRALRPLSRSDCEDAMAGIRSAFAGRGRRSGSGRPMKRQEVAELAKDGLVTIGAHSVTHPALTGLGSDSLGREIIGSKLACEEIVESPVRNFAYPYGDYNEEVRKGVQDAGFTDACSTSRAPVTKGSDLFAIPRIQVFDWDGDHFDKVLHAVSRDY